MKKLILAALAATVVFAPVTASAGKKKINLNPPFGSTEFQAWQLFEPGVTADKGYKQNVIVFLHGFGSAMPNSNYKRVYKMMRKTHTVVGVNYNDLDAAATDKFLNAKLAPKLKGRQVTVMGTSLGGFWAVRFGKQVKAACIVLVNPVVAPHTHLKKYIGKTRKNVRRDVEYKVTAAGVGSYGSIALKDGLGPKMLLMLSAKDKRVPPKTAQDRFSKLPGVTTIVYPDTKHNIKLKKVKKAKKAIGKYIKANCSAKSA